jgi:hypothetical protein
MCGGGVIAANSACSTPPWWEAFCHKSNIPDTRWLSFSLPERVSFPIQVSTTVQIESVFHLRHLLWKRLVFLPRPILQVESLARNLWFSILGFLLARLYLYRLNESGRECKRWDYRYRPDRCWRGGWDDDLDCGSTKARKCKAEMKLEESPVDTSWLRASRPWSGWSPAEIHTTRLASMHPILGKFQKRRSCDEAGRHVAWGSIMRRLGSALEVVVQSKSKDMCSLARWEMSHVLSCIIIKQSPLPSVI